MPQLAKFDYSIVSPGDAGILRECETEVRTRLKRSAEDIVEIGKALSRAKKRLTKTGFERWLERACGISSQQARNFMHVAERYDGAQSLDAYNPSALYVLAAPKTPEKARKEAAKKAERGERVTVQDAREAKARHAAEPPQEPPQSQTHESPHVEPLDAREAYTVPQNGSQISRALAVLEECIESLDEPKYGFFIGQVLELLTRIGYEPNAN